MAHLTEKDFKKIAEAVADDLIQNEIPLNDSITKLSQDMGMSQEQVRRLCEATNNVTFNKMFQARDKTASDRMIEFPVADANAVLKNSIKQAEADPGMQKAAAYELRPLADEMHYRRNPEPEATAREKVAFELRPESAPSREIDKRTLLKVAEHLKMEKMAADMQYRDTLFTLHAEFSKLYDAPQFEEFEKSAAALYQQSAVTPLADLRILFNKPEVVYNFDVLTKTAGLVDDTTPAMQLFEKLVTFDAARKKHAAGLEKVESLL